MARRPEGADSPGSRELICHRGAISTRSSSRRGQRAGVRGTAPGARQAHVEPQSDLDLMEIEPRRSGRSTHLDHSAHDRLRSSLTYGGGSHWPAYDPAEVPSGRSVRCRQHVLPAQRRRSVRVGGARMPALRERSVRWRVRARCTGDVARSEGASHWWSTCDPSRSITAAAVVQEGCPGHQRSFRTAVPSTHR
jgi:hypothetical protein